MRPNFISYNSLITRCAKRRHDRGSVGCLRVNANGLREIGSHFLQLVDQCVRKTRHAGPIFDVVSYSSLITACANGGKTKPNVVSYSSLITACGKAGQVLDVFGEMQAVGVNPNVISYSPLITRYAKRRQDREGAGCFRFHASGLREIEPHCLQLAD